MGEFIVACAVLVGVYLLRDALVSILSTLLDKFGNKVVDATADRKDLDDSKANKNS